MYLIVERFLMNCIYGGSVLSRLIPDQLNEVCTDATTNPVVQITACLCKIEVLPFQYWWTVTKALKGLIQQRIKVCHLHG